MTCSPIGLRWKAVRFTRCKNGVRSAVSGPITAQMQPITIRQTLHSPAGMKTDQHTCTDTAKVKHTCSSTNRALPQQGTKSQGDSSETQESGLPRYASTQCQHPSQVGTWCLKKHLWADRLDFGYVSVFIWDYGLTFTTQQIQEWKFFNRKLKLKFKAVIFFWLTQDGSFYSFITITWLFHLLMYFFGRYTIMLFWLTVIPFS